MKLHYSSFKDIHKLSDAAAAFIQGLSGDFIKSKGSFSIVLSGGNTPRKLYDQLSRPDYRDRINWQDTYIFWGDERYVPKDDILSNYNMAYTALISKIQIPDKNIFPMPDPDESKDAKESSELYEKTLRRFFQSDPESKNFPSFDLILLGMGSDGHTASLVPGSPILNEKKRWVSTTDVPDYILVKHRITLTLPVLNNAKNVLFFVSGNDKKEILRKIMNDKERKKYPAGLIEPQGDLYWYTDIPEKEIMQIT